jgi:uncharacterized protein (TIGR00730 family)
MRSVCVFCGSSVGSHPAYRSAARRFGELLARSGRRLVFGGGHVGLMGAVADGALDAGGAAVGVIPRALVDRELAHEGLTELHVVESMHERKALMATLADGFVALPGGLGTFEELFEVWTWGQLGIHAKPFGLLNVAGYYGALLEFLDHSASQGFVRPGHRDLLLVDSDPEALLSRMVDHRPPTVAKWMDRTET